MKFCIKFNEEILPILEDEVLKVIQAMQSKAIVVLSCGVIHGGFIRGVVRDIHAERNLYYYEKLTTDDRLQPKDYQIELPENVLKFLGKNVLIK